MDFVRFRRKLLVPNERASATVPRPVGAYITKGQQAQMKRVLVINSKGGCGKSTLSTNLAAMLGTKENNTVALIDYDPQGSSKKWLGMRSQRLNTIAGLFPARDNVVHFRRTWYLSLDRSTTHAIIDTPAGTNGLELSDRISQCDLMIVPVMPSAIDIRASADFVGKVITNPKFRSSRKRIAVVANRVKPGSESFEKLERFLISLKIPFIASFNEHNCYLIAAEIGCGINELSPNHDIPDKDEWNKVINWVNSNE